MRKIGLIITAAFVVLILLAIKPAAVGHEHPGISKGKVVTVFSGGVNDAVFRIEGQKRTFYINRGYENFSKQALESLVGTNAVITYSDGWTPLDPFNKRSLPIQKLEIDGKTFWKE